MNLNSFSGGIYRITNWITKIVYINILWFFFSLLALVILGIFPATAAMFAVCRKWIIGEEDIPVFQTFWKNYKQEFLKSNLLGLILVVVGTIMYIDYLFLTQVANGIFKVILLPFIPLTIIFVLFLFFIFPVYVHFDAKLFHLIKNAFFITLLHPFTVLLMILATFIIYLVIVSIPGLIPFFGVSVLAWILMYLANNCFSKIELKGGRTFKSSPDNISSKT